MQKKAVGIMVGVAAAHVLLLGGLLVSGGCKSPEILGTRKYETGPSPSTGVAPAAPAATAVEAAPAAAVPAEVPAAPKTEIPGLDSIPEVPVDQAAAPAAGSVTYTVKSGDTLSGIAYQYGIKSQTLAAANGLTLKSVLKVGQKLQIPEGATYHPERAKKAAAKKSAAKAPKQSGAAAAAAPAAALEGGVYTVKSGDSLAKIGKRYHVSAEAIAKANNISTKKVLQIGDKLVIPGASGATAAAPAAATVATATTPAATTPAAPDPFAGIDATAVVSDAPAATAAPANAAPATAVPAVDALTPASAPAPAPAPAAVEAPVSTATEAMEVQDDTTVDAFCRANGYKKEDVVRLNPDLPADGKVRRGDFLVVPNL